jgi:hypothetical protein
MVKRSLYLLLALSITAAPNDGDAAKAFVASCNNPYTKLYAEAPKKNGAHCIILLS